MIEINWNEAPEGATHYTESALWPSWWKVVDNTNACWYFSPNTGKWSPHSVDDMLMSRFIERPKEKTGVKFDSGKPQFRLLPPDAILDVVKVLTYGAKKYAPDNWKHVARERYIDAHGRHMNAYARGEEFDEETGISHLAHATCCLLFLAELDKM